jgi:hypothetical protein
MLLGFRRPYFPVGWAGRRWGQHRTRTVLFPIAYQWLDLADFLAGIRGAKLMRELASWAPT